MTKTKKQQHETTPEKEILMSIQPSTATKIKIQLYWKIMIMTMEKKRKGQHAQVQKTIR